MVRERNNDMTTVEHIRARLGMYWLTRDGIPDKSVWVFLLDQLANEMAEAFGRREISYVDIRVSDADGRSRESSARGETWDLNMR